METSTERKEQHCTGLKKIAIPQDVCPDFPDVRLPQEGEGRLGIGLISHQFSGGRMSAEPKSSSALEGVSSLLSSVPPRDTSYLLPPPSSTSCIP